MTTHRESDRFSARGTDGNTYVVIRYADTSSGDPEGASLAPSSYQTSDGQQVQHVHDRFIIRDSGVLLQPDEPPFHNLTYVEEGSGGGRGLPPPMGADVGPDRPGRP